MAIYENNINIYEEYLVENTLNGLGLSKDDLSDKNKVLNAVENEEKKKGPIEAIKLIFTIIGIAILSVGIIILSPIIIPLLFIIPNLIDKVEDKKKNKEIDKTINELNKLIEKLEKKKLKEKDPAKIKEYDKVINESKKKIKEIEDKRINDQYLKKIENGKEDIKKVVGRAPYYLEDAFELALWLTYYNPSQSEFESAIKKAIETDKEVVSYFDAKENTDWDDGKESYEYFKSNNLFGTSFVIFEAIDDTILLYSFKQKKIWYGGEESAKSVRKYDINTFKSKLKDFCYYDWDSLMEADKYLGYYKLSKPEKGVTPKPLPPYTK